jgi:PD-(D/E)XK nuclease superfamily
MRNRASVRRRESRLLLVSNIDIRVRASSFADLADCPARWFARHIEKRFTPSGPAATIGKALHASTAAYDQSTLSQEQISIDDSAGIFVDALRMPDEEVDWSQDDRWTVREAERVGLMLNTRYCTEVAPTRNYIEVESNLGEVAILVPSANVTVTITGHTDRIREDADTRKGVSDLKSGARIVSTHGVVETKGHAYQLAAYSLLYEINYGSELTAPAEIIGLNTGKTIDTQRVATGRTEQVKGTLLGTEERPGLIQAIAHMARDGMWFGNPKSSLCSAKFCPIYNDCQFRR